MLYPTYKAYTSIKAPIRWLLVSYPLPVSKAIISSACSENHMIRYSARWRKDQVSKKDDLD